MLFQIVQNCRTAGEGVEDTFISARCDRVQHVKEVMVESGEGNATAEGKIKPCLDTAERGVAMTSIEGGVI